MSYIDRINNFWRVSHETNLFSTTEIALYFHLLDISNRCNWPDLIKRNNAKIQSDLSISYKTLQNARNRLKQTGLIDFKTHNGSSNVAYTLGKFPKVRDEVTAEVGDEVRDEVGAEVGDELIKSKNKSKTKKEIKEKSPSDDLSIREKKFVDSISEYIPKYGRAMIDEFVRYWTEPNQRKKMRFELQKTWDSARRLETWFKNQDKFGQNSRAPAGQILQPENEDHKKRILNRWE